VCVRVVLRSVFSIAQLLAALVLGGTALAFTLAALGPSLADIWGAKTTASAPIDLSILEQTTIVYDANGELIAELRAEIDRENVALGDMAPEIVNAVLAVEDAKFYEHAGVNVAAITRAAVTNVSAGGIEQGGSTITQQLVKLGVVGDEQVLERKIPEAAIAMRLEEQMTKEEILERYLNAVYFGGGAYGVQAAAELYFNKDAGTLDYGEAALLSGLISNPSLYDPVYRPTNALNRRNVALGRLLAEGFITTEEREVWNNSPLPRYRQLEGETFLDTYFVEEVKRTLLDDPRLGADRAERINVVFQGGLEVYTTFDPVAQALAENAMAQEFPDNDLGIISALVSVEPGSGAVRAMIGGPGFEEFEFNVTTQKGRPTGSSFKPFALAAAIEHGGFLPSDSINASSPCEFDNPGGFPNPYEAGDYNGSRRSGALTIEDHTLRSTNCGYLRISQLVGLNNVVDTAKDLGVTESNIEAVISLPLGPYDITPLEMANSYATIANDGIRVEPHLITRVVQGSTVLIEHDPKPFRAIRPQTARLVTDVLEKNVACPKACTGRRAQLANHPAAGKTGTGQSNYDAWFVGYTAQLATAVWIGGQEGQIAMRYDWRDPEQDRDDYRRAFGEFADSGVTGGSLPAMIWGRFMNDYMAGLPVVEFIAPEPGRRGERLALDAENEEPEVVRISPCGNVNAEVDQDGDGDVDWCRPQAPIAVPDTGCPALLVPVDRPPKDGIPDDCVIKDAPEGSYDPLTTTTTIAPEGGGEGDGGEGDGNGEGEGGEGDGGEPAETTTAAPETTVAPTTTVAP
jgi:penicillin-binding protein 1A